MIYGTGEDGNRRNSLICLTVEDANRRKQSMVTPEILAELTSKFSSLYS